MLLVEQELRPMFLMVFGFLIRVVLVFGIIVFDFHNQNELLHVHRSDACMMLLQRRRLMGNIGSGGLNLLVLVLGHGMLRRSLLGSIYYIRLFIWLVYIDC